MTLSSAELARQSRERTQLDQDRELAKRIGKEAYEAAGGKLPAADALRRLVSDGIARRSWVSSKFDGRRLDRLADLGVEEAEILAGARERVVAPDTRERAPLVPPDEIPPELRRGVHRNKLLEEKTAAAAPAPPRRKPPPARSIPAGPAPAPKQTPTEEVMKRLDGKNGPTAAEWLRAELKTLQAGGWEGKNLQAELARRAFDAGIVSGRIDGVWYNHVRPVLIDAGLEVLLVAKSLKELLEDGVPDPELDDQEEEEEEDEGPKDQRIHRDRRLEGESIDPRGEDADDRRLFVQRKEDRVGQRGEHERADASRTADLDARVERARAVRAAAEGVTVDELESAEESRNNDEVTPAEEELEILQGPRPFGDPWPDVERKCVVCGCVDEDCSQCIEATGEPCEWVLAGPEGLVCSRCANDAVELLLRNRDVDPSSDGPEPGPAPEPPVDKLFLSGAWGEFTILQEPGDPGGDVHVTLHGSLPAAAADKVAAVVLASRYPRSSPL